MHLSLHKEKISHLEKSLRHEKLNYTHCITEKIYHLENVWENAQIYYVFFYYFIGKYKLGIYVNLVQSSISKLHFSCIICEKKIKAPLNLTDL
jgi:ribosome biogenesis GTPase A